VNRLRYVAEVNPVVPGLSRSVKGREVSFLPLDRVWADDRFDPSETIEYTGDVQSYNPVAEGDLLVPKVAPTFTHGRVAIAQGLANGLALATSEVFVVRAHDSSAPRFLKYRLIASDFRQEGEASWVGVAGLKRISAGFLKDVRISQQAWCCRVEIAEFLDRECARIDDLVDAAGAMKASLFAACRETFVRLTADAPQMRLRFALRSIEQGWSPVCDSREVEEGEWGVLKLGCVNGGAFRDLHKALADGLTPRPELEVHDGDLLMSRANTRDLVGSAAVVTRIRPSLMLSDLLYRLRLDDGWEPAFLASAIGTAGVRAQIEAIAAGSAGSMPKLNQESIKNLRVPSLPPAEQRIVIEASDQAASAPRAAIAECDALEAQLHEYRDALITEAVTGQLDVTRLSEAQMEEDLDAVRQGERPEVLTT
jgi:type I restriction enzyme S subunit